LKVFLQVIRDLSLAIGAASDSLKSGITTLWAKLLFQVVCYSIKHWFRTWISIQVASYLRKTGMASHD
jgi:hypothetical protein